MSQNTHVSSTTNEGTTLTTIVCSPIPILDSFSFSPSPSVQNQLYRREIGTHPMPQSILSLSHMLPAHGSISVPDIGPDRRTHAPAGLSSLALAYHSTDLTFSSAAHHTARTQALADLSPLQSKLMSTVAIEPTHGRLLATAGDNGICFSPAHTQNHHAIIPPAITHKHSRARSSHIRSSLLCLPRAAVTHVPLPPVRVSSLRWVDEQLCVATAWDGALRMIDVGAASVACTTSLPGPLLEADIGMRSHLSHYSQLSICFRLLSPYPHDRITFNEKHTCNTFYKPS